MKNKSFNHFLKQQQETFVHWRWDNDPLGALQKCFDADNIDLSKCNRKSTHQHLWNSLINTLHLVSLIQQQQQKSKKQ